MKLPMVEVQIQHVLWKDTRFNNGWILHCHRFLLPFMPTEGNKVWVKVVSKSDWERYANPVLGLRTDSAKWQDVEVTIKSITLDIRHIEPGEEATVLIDCEEEG